MRSLIPDELEEQLNTLQIDLVLKGQPVAILFEGGSGRVISRVVNEFDRVLEPMGIRYHHFDATHRGTGHIADLLDATPGKGEIALYDRSWYSMVVDRYDGDEDSLKEQMDAVRRFEEYLVDSGTYLIKICLTVTPEILKRHAEDYRAYTPLNHTFLSVDHVDRVKFRAVMPKLIKMTDTDHAPWDVIEVGRTEDTVTEIVETVVKRLKHCIKGGCPGTSDNECPSYPNPRKGLDLDAESDDYQERMDALSAELARLQILLASSDRSLTLCFEGWDAAGKGGAIKHVCHALNPRGYTVTRVKAPSEEALAHTYLWRFARTLPSRGQVSIYDRSWYGRMLVEPVEGFCSEDDYCRSAQEINAFERMLTDAGGMVLKFWLDIDSETQLQRFEERREDPLKQWKLTDEDWRNREKWDDYDGYVDRMMRTTNTPNAPWSAVPANNKKAARLCVMQSIVDLLKRELDI
ncbi:MAG: hypothetical protein MJZ38_02570 [archaeon]|nr:hypothetical protein [archaeon]